VTEGYQFVIIIWNVGGNLQLRWIFKLSITMPSKHMYPKIFFCNLNSPQVYTVLYQSFVQLTGL